MAMGKRNENQISNFGKVGMPLKNKELNEYEYFENFIGTKSELFYNLN
jgi:hypothetical protein